VRDGAAALASRTFRVNSFFARPLRIAPAGTFEGLALKFRIISWSTRPTADDSHPAQVRSPSREPAPPARPAHHTHRALRFHPLHPPVRLVLVLRTVSASRRRSGGSPRRLAAVRGSKPAACARIRLVGRLAHLRAPRRWSHGRWVSRSGARARERERRERRACLNVGGFALCVHTKRTL
jgi:hypothetical protein